MLQQINDIFTNQIRTDDEVKILQEAEVGRILLSNNSHPTLHKNFCIVYAKTRQEQSGQNRRKIIRRIILKVLY